MSDIFLSPFPPSRDFVARISMNCYKPTYVYRGDPVVLCRYGKRLEAISSTDVTAPLTIWVVLRSPILRSCILPYRPNRTSSGSSQRPCPGSGRGSAISSRAGQEGDRTPGRVKLWSASSRRQRLCVPGNLLPSALEYRTPSYLQCIQKPLLHQQWLDLHWDPTILYPVDGQCVDVMWEPVPYYAGIPVTEFFDLMGIYPQRSGFSGNGDLEFVVADGGERVFYARVKSRS